jgi:hypothetical protein
MAPTFEILHAEGNMTVTLVTRARLLADRPGRRSAGPRKLGYRYLVKLIAGL